MIIVDKYIRFYGISKYDINRNTFWVSKGHDDRFYKMINNYQIQIQPNISGIMGLRHFSGDQELSVSNEIPYMTNKEYRKKKLEKLKCI